MAVPKRRKSSRKVREGRSVNNWKFQKKFANPPLINCANCQNKKILHQVCAHCLTYKKLTFAKNNQ